MSYLHHKPTTKTAKKFDIGFVERWAMKEIESANITHHTLVGGKENINESKHDRILIVIDGFATNLDTKEVIRDGTIIEIPAGRYLRVQGQLKYYMLTIS